MKLKSEDLEENGFIPSRFTCDGEDVSPQVRWEDVPEGARSFALSMTDPDAPGGTFVHWLIYNIPKDVRRIERGGLPAGARQKNGAQHGSGVHAEVERIAKRRFHAKYFRRSEVKDRGSNYRYCRAEYGSREELAYLYELGGILRR